MMRALLLLTVLLLPLAAQAGCISNCRDDYESEVDSCNLRNDDPDDADDLMRCIDDAKDEFESCKDECKN